MPFSRWPLWRRAGLLVVLVGLAACGGGDPTQPAPPAPPPPPPPPPPPAPVASVVLSETAPVMVPQGTLQLTASPRDAQGNTLAGRTITWTTSAQTVATVSASGLVTAHALGNATITATSEGQSGIAQLSVVQGATVTTQGGTFTFQNGAVTLAVPAGAVSSPVAMTVVEDTDPPPAAPAGYQISGKVYRLGPVGVTFAQPVTVTLKYDPGKLPSFAMSGDLAVLQRGTGAWSGLSDVAVNVAAGTISGKAASFAVAPPALAGADGPMATPGGGAQVAVGVLDPTVSLTPGSVSLNAQQRVAIFTAVLAPRGQGIPLPAASLLKYRWSTTGQNGGLSGPGPSTWTDLIDMQYTATAPQLSQMSGEIDRVTVEVLLNPEVLADPSLGPPRIITAEAVIDADLRVTYDITPQFSTIGPGDTKDLHFLIRDQQGNEITLPNAYEIEWNSSANHGSIPSGLGNRVLDVTYTAMTTFQSAPPRVDDVEAVAFEVVQHVIRTAIPAPLGGFINMYDTTHTTRPERGRAKGFIEVEVQYEATLTPQSSLIRRGESTNLSVTINPAYTGPGLEYKYSTSGGQGTINHAAGTRVTSPQVTLTADTWAPGGMQTVIVEVVSVVAGVELETIATGSVEVEVDPWHSGRFAVERTNAGLPACVNVYVYAPKVAGATSYQLVADQFNDPDGVYGTMYSKTFSGPTGTGVDQVQDAGSEYRILLVPAGCSSILESSIQARITREQNRFAGIRVRVKASQ